MQRVLFRLHNLHVLVSSATQLTPMYDIMPIRKSVKGLKYATLKYFSSIVMMKSENFNIMNEE